MRFTPRLMATGLLLLALPSVALARTKRVSRHTSAHSVRYSSAHTSRHTSARGHHPFAAVHHEAPAGMPPERATEIQSALIKQGYLSGEPSGHWDAESIAAMQKMQSDNGWQTKVTPDSRALIKLGLGPHSDSQNMAAN